MQTQQTPSRRLSQQTNRSGLRSRKVYGCQTPVTRIEDPWNIGPANEGISWVAKHGLKLDPWQEITVQSWLSYEDDYKFTHSRAGLSVPRQNGKSALLEARALIGMALMGEAILFTAHNTTTARTFFRRLKGFFEDTKHPDLVDMVHSIKEAPGHEAIWLNNGGSLQVLARHKGSGRGFTVDVIMFDEAQELSAESLEALGPATSAAPLRNRQLIFCGTPPSEVMNSEVFTKFRLDCLSGDAVNVSWFEWCIPDGSDIGDPENWALANPALGYRLNIGDIEEDRSGYSDEGFARERGGMWSAAATGAVIDAEAWGAVADAGSMTGDVVAFAVDISPDRQHASIAVAGARPDGLYHTEVIENRRGTDWVVPFLAGLVAQCQPVAVVVDGPASSLIPELGNLEVPVHRLGMNDFGSACALFYDSVLNRALRHPNQPLFNTAVDAVRKRPLGEQWAWGRRDTKADITPVVSATLALYGFLSARPVDRPKKKKKAVTL
ncbi:hypothetical protein AB0G00_24060 [Nocardia salmonicida]|uniref:hypothetical protein n=1 Tax=Nocardia salmonicida TaxID=53431 RepID=UPI0033E9E0A0